MGLKEKLLAREATLGVIGLGYVGLPLAVEKAKAGFKVYGFDVQKEKVDMVNAGKNYIGDVVNEDLEARVKAGQLVATANFADAAKCDCVCICVPTPLDAHQQPDISYVRSSTESIMPYIHKDMLVVLESMKMENYVYAPVKGTVTKIFVGPAAGIEAGETLMTIDVNGASKAADGKPATDGNTETKTEGGAK